MPNRTIQTEPVSEGATAPITGVCEAPNGTPIPGSQISSVKVTLTNEATGTVINSRSNVELVGTSGFSIDESGNFSWETLPADNVIVDNARRLERHVARFDGTYATTKKFRVSLTYPVSNFSGVT